MNPRILKIEEDGDFWLKKTKPKIRLMGRWLEQMGFPPHRHVVVTMIQPGLLQLKLKPDNTELELQEAVPSFEECVAALERLHRDIRSAFTPAWRHRCKRDVAEWEALIAKHYLDQYRELQKSANAADGFRGCF